MKILHLCFDGHAIDVAISIFERFYPNSNIWVISGSTEKSSRLIKNEGDNIYWINPGQADSPYLQLIHSFHNHETIEKIVCHGVTGYYFDVIKVFPKERKPKVYWLFWGYELYRSLGYTGKMHLVDHVSVFNPLFYVLPTKYAGFFRTRILGRQGHEERLKEMLKYADYFCFWLYEDYLLLQNYYPCPIKFRHFQYAARWKGTDNDYCIPGSFFEKVPKTILVNHQASTTGNHLTILRKLRSFSGIEDYQITSPLSYGSRTVRWYVSWRGKSLFEEKFHALEDYMRRDDYHKLIGQIEVAIFGQLRQEAAGNIEFLLSNGTKVFMREKNTLFRHYKKQGYVIFSFEQDLKSTDDLVGLSLEDKMHNMKIHNESAVYYEDFMPTLLDD